MAVELVLPCRGVTDGHAHDPHEVESVVKVVPPVRPLAYVRGKQQPQPQLVLRVLVLAENDPFVPPIGQVIHRGGPTDIVVDAEDGSIEFIVGAIDIDSVAKHMGFTVRYVLPGRKIWVKHLLPHNLWLASPSLSQSVAAYILWNNHSKSKLACVDFVITGHSQVKICTTCSCAYSFQLCASKKNRTNLSEIRPVIYRSSLNLSKSIHWISTFCPQICRIASS